MCGFTGLFAPRTARCDARDIDTALLHRMTAAIAHRGPDDEGFHTEPGIGLGFRRLAIIDLAAGHQPMANEDGTVTIAFNGEIYNFQSLRDELLGLGHVFATHCDTEVIIHGWESWGLAVLDRLDGFFAFALWDRQQATLLLARDRLGKKPLYYGTAPDGNLAFGSELAALTPVPGLTDRLDPAALEDYLAFGYVPDPASIYQRIRKLPPAHFMLIEAGAPLPPPRRYWTLPEPTTPPASLDEAAADLRTRLDKAVAARMIADVPLGAFLSGGVDSSAIVALAARHAKSPLQSFTIGFPGTTDERATAAAMAEHCGALHTSEVVAPTDVIDAARHQAEVFGEPFGDHSSVPSLAVARLARAGVKVALSGDGGDEVFGGYRRYRWHAIADQARRLLPDRARRALLAPIAAAYPKLDRAPAWLRAKTTLTEISLDSAHGYYRTLCKLQDTERRGLMSPALRSLLDGHDPAAGIIAALDTDADPLRAAQMVDLATYLPGDILVKVDRTSMRSGVEVRSPLLDPALLAWGMGLPPALKLRAGQGKSVLRAAVAPLLPRDVLDRPKQGFVAPISAELRRAAPRLRGTLLGAAMLDTGWFDGAAIGRMIDQHESGQHDHGWKLWHLLVLEGFLARHAGAAMPAATPVLVA
ncbi:MULTISPECIES: asparagine synthase (glutamine-hydrolyzing) [Acidiphilium]|uniref:asparagine synthase (glutamine-hydrolyzing) n=1 Tax=Acidiphilium rubrum TaxID=526 RepID=A0A8G2CJ20_ACIRU|nr:MULTISPECIES: asparagine synthase (glutamine-hydrolyzing) [Acidiphilium]SIQ40670.1 asparagine synthase (glutamine-hydrolysing) [Acidiphilium rubrum]